MTIDQDASTASALDALASELAELGARLDLITAVIRRLADEPERRRRDPAAMQD